MRVLHRRADREEDEPHAEMPGAPHREQRAEAEKEGHAREEEPLQENQAPVAVQIFLVGAAEPRELRLFLPVGTNDANARQRLLGNGADICQLSLYLLEPLVNRIAEVLH